MPATPATKETRPPPRERLLAAADDLFYAEGVQSVGIDRIIERAGVAKASLYHSFSSKEELVTAYLDRRRARVTGPLTQAMDAAGSPRQKIVALFGAQAEMIMESGFRGCAFVAASTEAPEGGLVQIATENYRLWIRQTLIRLARDAGAPDPELLGRQLHLLYDGASIAARLDQSEREITTAAQSAVEVLLEAALPSQTGRARKRE
jgi:AcrR family transcriptional regulator